jgi:hypothetical protein
MHACKHTYIHIHIHNIYINKNALDKNIDFFILTENPSHYTTLKRIPHFKQKGLMDSFLDYEITLVPSNRNKHKTKRTITIVD